MVYKASFNSLKIYEDGVYSAYNLTSNELESLKRRFGSKVNGSNGNYTAFGEASRRVVLQLFVHGRWQPVKFEIRKDLLKVFNSKKLYKKNIEKLDKKLKDMRLQLDVDYDGHDHRWQIVNYNSFLELLSKLIAED